MNKKIISTILAVTSILSSLSVTVSASQSDNVQSNSDTELSTLSNSEDKADVSILKEDGLLQGTSLPDEDDEFLPNDTVAEGDDILVPENEDIIIMPPVDISTGDDIIPIDTDIIVPAVPTIAELFGPQPQSIDFSILEYNVPISSIIVNNTLCMPVLELLSNLCGYSYVVDGDSVTYTCKNKNITLTVGSTTAYINGKQSQLAVAPYFYDGVMYAPMRFLCEAIGYSVSTGNIYGNMWVHVDTKDNIAIEKRMNDSGIYSDTSRLIWVNKSKYTVYVFTGEAGNWHFQYSMPCAIGAPSTPTVTGIFKYFSKESAWKYNNYYVGPIMRFYKGYALHSTLLKYDGTPYDNTVGRQISHGCVRLRSADINKLASTIPLKTTVYVTAN